MKKVIILFSHLFFLSTLSAQLPLFQWAKGIGSTLDDRSESVATDSYGNVYAAGSFKGVVDFDPGPSVSLLGSGSKSAIFLTKFDPMGQFIWAKCLEDSTIFPVSLATDQSGNLIVSGGFRDIVDFDPGPASFTLSSNGHSDAFVLKLNPNGNFLWAGSFGASNPDVVNDVKVDNTGNIFLTGVCYYQVDFDPGPGTYTLGTANDTSMFVSKLDPSGNIIWGALFKGTGIKEASGIAIDPTGSIYVGGRFFKTVDFDPGPSVFSMWALGGGDGFICKLNASGNFIWAKQFGAADADDVTGITTDQYNSVYVTGITESNVVDFDPGPGTYTVGTNAMVESFVLKLFSSGDFAWVRTASSVFITQAYAIEYDGKGNLYTCGSFSGTNDFDPGPGTSGLTQYGFYDMFIVKYDTTGNYIWAGSMGGSFSENMADIAPDGYGNVFTTGFYYATSDFDFTSSSYSVTSNGGADFFIHKINNCYAPSVPVNLTPAASLTVCPAQTTTLVASSTGTINWYTNATATGTPVNSGNTYYVSFGSAGTYTFYTQAINCSSVSGISIITVTVDMCTGIEENESSGKFIVYPNPANGSLQVQFRDRFTKNSNIVLSNALGQVIWKGHTENPGDLLKIDISAFPKGIYFLKMADEGMGGAVKIIKN